MAGRLEDVILRGVRADQPSASNVSPGTLYFVTDEHVTERSNGIAWQSYSGSGSGTGGSFINGSPFPVPIDGVDGEDSIPIPGPTGPAGTSGINQLTGDVTAGPGNGSQAATIANDAVTTAKILNDAITSAKIVNDAIVTAKIIDDAVTYAKLQNVSAASKLLGRGSASGAGNAEEITLGTNLSMSGTTINASAGAGGGWSLINSNSPTAVTLVDFSNLAGYSEILVFLDRVTLGGSQKRFLLVSIDNGVTFLNSSGDYKTSDTNGVLTNASDFALNPANSAAALTVWAVIKLFNQTCPKIITDTQQQVNSIVQNVSALNAVRVVAGGGFNLTGGTIYIYGR